MSEASLKPKVLPIRWDAANWNMLIVTLERGLQLAAFLLFRIDYASLAVVISVYAKPSSN